MMMFAPAVKEEEQDENDLEENQDMVNEEEDDQVTAG